MATRLDLLKRDVELARDHVIRVAYQIAASHPVTSELKRACDRLDDAEHRVYEEEAAIAA